MALLVTLVNRSSKTLTGTWDGRQYDLIPGRHAFPAHIALKFKLQNPVMGSEDRFANHTDYLLGIVEEGDPITPIEQTDAIERWTRTEQEMQRVEVIPGKTGVYSGRDVASSLPNATNFTKA